MLVDLVNLSNFDLKNDILSFADNHGLGIVFENIPFERKSVDLYLKEFPVEKISDAPLDILIDSVEIQRAVGLSIGTKIFSNPEVIPKKEKEEWEDSYIFVGDIFEDKNHNYFLLSFFLEEEKSNWNFVFMEVVAKNSIPPNAKLICFE